MNSKIQDRNLISTLVLVITAVILLIFAYTSNRNDLTTGAVILSAIILFLTGIFLFTMVKDNLIDSGLVSLLPVQSTINLCRIATDLGIQGHSVFIPGLGEDDSKVMQFIPVSVYKRGELSGDSFVSGTGGTGILIVPQGETIVKNLKKRGHLQVPHVEAEILTLIKEISEDTLEITEKIDILKTGDGYFCTMSGYELISGCHAIHQESPECCLMNPCPICSMIGMILAEGINQPITIERCYPDKKRNIVELHFTNE